MRDPDGVAFTIDGRPTGARRGQWTYSVRGRAGTYSEMLLALYAALDAVCPADARPAAKRYAYQAWKGRPGDPAGIPPAIVAAIDEHTRPGRWRWA